ncbi:MAG: zinc metallopeptidase [Akkermansiaceae bacterium]
MRQIILLLSLLPMIVVFICKKWYVDRVFKQTRTQKLPISAHELSQQMLAAIELHQVKIKTPKKRWLGSSQIGAGWLVLPAEISHSQTVYANGHAALTVGLYLLQQRNPELSKRRQWAIRFGHVFPLFVILVLVFACVVAKLSVLWAISALMAALGAASFAQILTLMANLQAVDLASVILEKKAICPYARDQDLIIVAAKSSAWAGLIPGLLGRFI